MSRTDGKEGPISFIAFPLRFDGSFLRRCDGPEAVLALVRVMANTPYGSWAGCRQFGLRDLLEQCNIRSEKIQTAVQEMNRVLEDLGIVTFRVESITRESPAGAEVSHWVLNLVSTTDQTKTYSFEWDGKTQ